MKIVDAIFVGMKKKTPNSLNLDVITNFAKNA